MMSFLLGAYGTYCTSDFIKNLSYLGEKNASGKTIEKFSFKNGFIVAGTQNEYDHDRIIPLQKDGIFVGKLFDREKYEPITFDHELATNCLANPRYITKNLWGRYVGAFFNKQTQEFSLIRDPQGLSTIFYYQDNDGIIFSTELSLLYQALKTKPSINIDYFIDHIIHTNYALSSTPFAHIKELQPGMKLTVNPVGKSSQELLWDIASFQGSFITDVQSFEEELLTTLRKCTKAWTEDIPGIGVELSGGTDSSGVMLLLRDILPEDKKLIAVNYIDSQTQSSNEIKYAQEIAKASNSELFFIDFETTSLIDKLPEKFLPNKPNTFLFGHARYQQLEKLLLQHGCFEIMSGQGGDHVFLAPPAEYALADYWLDRGLRGITKPLHELSGEYRQPWLSIIKQNLQALVYYYQKKCFAEKKEVPCLSQDFLKTFKKEDFYLDKQLTQMYPAKAAQIKSLHHAALYSERNQIGTSLTFTHPLLSQPVIELALRIPTYQSFKDGYDRIFFRNAITRLKKTDALWRKIKGHTTGTVVKKWASQAQEIRDIILEGKLVKNGILDVAWIEKNLIKAQHGQADNLWDLTHLLTAELWFRQWKL